MKALKNKLEYNDGGYALLIAIGCMVGAGIVYAVLSFAFADSFARDGIYLNIFLSQGMVLMAFVLFMRLKKPKPDVIGVRKVFNPWLLLLIPVAALCIYAFYPATYQMTAWLEFIGFKSKEMSIPLRTVGQMLFAVFAVAVLPAIFEELVFRGAVFHALKERGGAFAVVVSAAAFALFHGNPDQTVYQFLLGLMLGYAVLRTGSVYAGMIMHFCSNLLAILYEYFGWKFWVPSAPGLFFGFAVVAAAAGLVLIPLLIQLIARPERMRNLELGIWNEGQNIYDGNNNSSDHSSLNKSIALKAAFTILALQWILVLLGVIFGLIEL
ncbi:MAG: CPBP family intramembrane metalloprotease [Firmicutes bacterium]|nr:CPBP family intramembrane metalloprotease [Bacillota bacterium]